MLFMFGPYLRSRDQQPKSPWLGFWTFALVVILIRSLILSPFRIPSGSMQPTLKVGDFILTSKMSYGWSSYSLFLGGYADHYLGISSQKVLAFSKPQRGDVVVFAYPGDPRIDYIKRVVGVPGDRVQMIKGRLHLNGDQLALEDCTEKYDDFEGHSEDGDFWGKGKVYYESLPRKDGTICKHKIVKQNPFGQSAYDDTGVITVEPDHILPMGDNRDRSQDGRSEAVGQVHHKYVLGKAHRILFSIDHQHLNLWKPWHWLAIPFKIRLNRILVPIR
jgi:signal peptidase I